METAKNGPKHMDLNKIERFSNFQSNFLLIMGHGQVFKKVLSVTFFKKCQIQLEPWDKQDNP